MRGLGLFLGAQRAGGGASGGAVFQTTWKTDNAGTSGPTQITLPLTNIGTYSMVVHWGDGTTDTITAWNDAAKTHTYAAGAGTYNVTISGVCRGWVFGGGGDRLKFLRINQWGSLSFSGTNGNTAFQGCANLTITATDAPTFVGATQIRQFFEGCTSLVLIPGASTWNTSTVTSTYAMFNGATNFNEPGIGSWNMSSVTTIGYMFQNSLFNQAIGGWTLTALTVIERCFFNAAAFNKPLTNWNVANVTDMSYLFYGATAFNGDLSGWNTGNVTSMAYMFYGCVNFNQDINSWNTAKVTNMAAMFYNNYAFNKALNSWDTSKVTDMSAMFQNCFAFNGNIAAWNTGLVTSMAQMFSSDTAFNADISAWNTANVTNMSQMFYGTAAFNQNISGWNTAKVTTMALMFFANNVFNQNIGAWNVEKVTTFASMFDFAGGMKQSLAAWSPLLATNLTLWNLQDINSPNSATNRDNYNNTLISWAGKALQPNVPLSMGASKYTIATAGVARAALVTNGWTINDGGGV